MEALVKGDVVVIPFPFSDLSGSKRRPALVVADAGGNDVIMCQITSRSVSDEMAIPVSDQDFSEGCLKQDSNIRPNKLFTADRGIILYKAGRISAEMLDSVMSSIITLLKK